jgi:hypothetical protein
MGDAPEAVDASRVATREWGVAPQAVGATKVVPGQAAAPEPWNTERVEALFRKFEKERWTLHAKHWEYPNKDGGTFIEKWGGKLFAVTPVECLKNTFCPFLAYATIGHFNMARISEHHGVEPPTKSRRVYEVVTMGFGYFNGFLCWAQGNRRRTLEVKLTTAADKYILSGCCVNGCPGKEAAIHFFCHPCALSQEVRAVNKYTEVIGMASLHQPIECMDCMCGLFRSNFPCLLPCLVCLAR